MEDLDPRMERVYAVLMSYKMTLATLEEEHVRALVSSMGDTLVRVLEEWASRDDEMRDEIEALLERLGMDRRQNKGLP